MRGWTTATRRVLLVVLCSAVPAAANSVTQTIPDRPGNGEIPVPSCRLDELTGGVGEIRAAETVAQTAAPWSEIHVDPVQRALLQCLLQQEKAYVQRGEQNWASATRSRIRGLRAELCQEYINRRLHCPLPGGIPAG